MLRHDGIDMVKATSLTGVLRAVIAASSVGLAPSGVGAADLSPDVEVDSFQVETPPPMPVFSWTGFTGGLQIGGQFGRDKAEVRAPASGDAFFGVDPRGVIGGAHVGYDHQLTRLFDGRALVLGLEADVDGASGRGSRSGGLPYGATVSTTSDMKGSIRARAGLPINRVLLYATGGAALAGFTTRVGTTSMGEPAAVDAPNRARAGFTLGGGVDYAFMNDLTLRAEYRYSDYGTFTDQVNLPAPVVGTVSHSETDHRVQAAISYRFGSIAPAAARD